MSVAVILDIKGKILATCVKNQFITGVFGLRNEVIHIYSFLTFLFGLWNEIS
jgi:hypothetical protein